MDGLHDVASTDDTSLHAADDFAIFFKDKVDAAWASSATMPAYEVLFEATTLMLEKWTAITVDEVEKLIASALNKTCQLDSAPTG